MASLAKSSVLFGTLCVLLGQVLFSLSFASEAATDSGCRSDLTSVKPCFSEARTYPRWP